MALFAGATVPPLRATDGPWGVPIAAADLDNLGGGHPYAVATVLAVAVARELRD